MFQFDVKNYGLLLCVKSAIEINVTKTATLHNTAKRESASNIMTYAKRRKSKC